MTKFSYLAQYNSRAADRVRRAIGRSIERLGSFPYSARESRIPGIRELVIVRYPYIVFHTVDDAAREVHILRVRHTSRDADRHLD